MRRFSRGHLLGQCDLDSPRLVVAEGLLSYPRDRQTLTEADLTNVVGTTVFDIDVGTMVGWSGRRAEAG